MGPGRARRVHLDPLASGGGLTHPMATGAAATHEKKNPDPASKPDPRLNRILWLGDGKPASGGNGKETTGEEKGGGGTCSFSSCWAAPCRARRRCSELSRRAADSSAGAGGGGTQTEPLLPLRGAPAISTDPPPPGRDFHFAKNQSVTAPCSWGPPLWNSTVNKNGQKVSGPAVVYLGGVHPRTPCSEGRRYHLPLAGDCSKFFFEKK